jgi:radical SAM protein with 4Fe4S-binding SPASM domain
VHVDGFVETKPAREEVLGKRVYGIDEIPVKDSGFILGLNGRNTQAVVQILSDRGYDLGNVIQAYLYMDGDTGKVTRWMIEVTTRIGCSVNCRYCPQSLLIREYTKNTESDINMSLETFQGCVAKLPQEYGLLFGGMSEPAQNPAFMDMLKFAVSTGRRVELYSTLEGIGEERIDELLDIPVAFMVLHVADKFGYAKIRTDESYYRKIEKVINHKKPDGSPYVNQCSAQAEPEERISRICAGKYTVNHALEDRAGNLSGDDLIKATGDRTGRFTCSLCGHELHKNILLPDGRVLACCMDYGLKHTLGNLITQTYDDINNSDERKKLQKAMDGDSTLDVLCRKCPCAVMQ